MAQDSFMVRALAAFKSFISFQFVVYFFYVGLVCSFFSSILFVGCFPCFVLFWPICRTHQVDSRRRHVSPTINLPRLLGQVSLVLEVLNRPYRSFKFWC